MIYAVRLSFEQTRIIEVIWQEFIASESFEYNPTEATLSQVIDALNNESKVYLMMQDESGKWINTLAEFKLVTYQCNEVGVYNVEYKLLDLPQF